jgi:hypothetical protein
MGQNQCSRGKKVGSIQDQGKLVRPQLYPILTYDRDHAKRLLRAIYKLLVPVTDCVDEGGGRAPITHFKGRSDWRQI